MSQEQRNTGASRDEEESAPLGVPDDQLPDDLQPSEDNPLAQPADQDDRGDVQEGDGPDR
jgi:hypothetical protein